MNRTDAEGFVSDFNRAYDEATSLGSLCTCSYYDAESETEDFFQIGRRTTVPVGLVEEGRYRYVSDDVVGALCEGEKRFVADRLGSLADEGRIPTVEGEGSPVETAADTVEEASALLVPRDEEGDATVAGWKEDGELRRLGDETYVVENGTDVWLHRHDGEGTYAVDAGRVTVVQKRGDDTAPPRFAVSGEVGDPNGDGRLSVYFAEPKDGLVETAYRVVVSEPVVEEGGACRVRRNPDG